MVGLITHDWIENDGGAEKVLHSITKIFPTADIFTLWDDSKSGSFQNRILESSLSYFKFSNRKIMTLPAMPLIWSRFDASKYDWVLASTHLFAHHINANSELNNLKKLVYVHTPARYIWDPKIDSRGKNPAFKLIAKPLRLIDRHKAQSIDAIAANSKFVKRRVEKYWKRDSTVIYPPVQVNQIQSIPKWEKYLEPRELKILSDLDFDFLFAASRLVKYKHIEKAIQFAKWNQVPIVIAGDGEQLTYLQTFAHTLNVRAIFLGRISDALMRVLYKKSIAYIFPPIEDFGIMPVEAMASGAVVIGNLIGGTSETIVNGESGLLTNFDDKNLCQEVFSQISEKLRQGAIQRDP